MKSRAHLRGHPIHPVLIPFPIALLYSAFFFDIAGRVLQRDAFHATAAHITVAGIAMGLVAGVFGFIDYRYTVPPRSTGKTRAGRHALLNVSALTLFAISYILRADAATAPGTVILLLEAVGLIALTCGSWMGGTLVTRNQISVDHRYAGAGKWREQDVTRRNGDLVIPKPKDLEVDQMMLLHDGDRRVVLGRTADRFVAFHDRCTHRGGSLADGVMMCGTVQCPWHGSQFDITTGAVRAGPTTEPIRTYSVEESEHELRIRATS